MARKGGNPDLGKYAAKKGEIRNPYGRNGYDPEVVKLAKQNTKSAISALVEIYEDKDNPPQARVHAAEAVLNRAWGKPSEHKTIDQKTETVHAFQVAFEEIGKLKAINGTTNEGVGAIEQKSKPVRN